MSTHRDYSMSLPDACEAINGHYSGTSDPMADDDLARTVTFLEGRIAAWVAPTHKGSAQAAYDDAMRLLCGAAVAIHYSKRGAS